MTEKAKLVIGDKELDLPIVVGSEGEKGLDISRLRQETGYVTIDPAFGNTAACESRVTFIDGEKGILRYRGIPIEQFSKTPNFVEVAWLLIFGRLPKREELSAFSERLSEHELLHEGFRHQFLHIPNNAPPMAILSAMLSNLACYHQELIDIDDKEEMIEAAARLISKVRTIAAFSYRSSQGLPFVYPDPAGSYCENFLHMMFSVPHKQYEVSKEIEDALNLIFILHADHEQNCSTSTVRTVGSAQANLFSSCSAGVSALWGPLHGGANVAVLDMLSSIYEGGLEPAEVIEKAKDKEDPFRLFGFGHRVYKNFDPRATILKESCDRVFAALDVNDPMLNTARKLEELALEDSYFKDRKLYPNVDFYSGLLLRATGFPTDMFTVLFAIGRLPGWIAHWREQHKDPTSRIIRPRQIYTGPEKNDYIPMDQR
jgi:citrate synthase